MPSAPRLASLEARLLLRAGLALWLLALLAAVWEVLALQPPDSPLHLGVLAGPIAQLTGFAFALGTLSVISAVSWVALYEPGEGRAVAWLLVLGALLHVVALLVAAARGLLAVQLLDPRADARFLLYGRGLGLSLTCAALISLLVRAARR